MNLIELLVSVAIIAILASLVAGSTSRAFSVCKKSIKRIELKHNQDIMAAVDNGFTYIELNGKLYYVSTGQQ
jgi:prepilin-type N-terminal cleavage/methylation domain-containing protein